MKKELRWISKKAMLLLQEEAIAGFGGERGLRDDGLLDSALARPLNLIAYNPESTLSELAASCAHGIAKNHPFVDGNKRAAFLAIGLMLGLNGKRLTASQVDAIETMTAVASGELDERGLAAWVEKNSDTKRAPREEHKRTLPEKSRFLTKTKPAKHGGTDQKPPKKPAKK